MKKIMSVFVALIIPFSVYSMSKTADKGGITKAEEVSKSDKVIYIKKEKEVNLKEIENTVLEKDGTESEIDEMAKYKYYQTGMASFYGGKWHGKKTANGERFDQYSMTAAHKTLPFGTKVRVTNLSNGKTVIVRINNRGPYVKGRIIDLSKGAFSKIESTGKGVTRVKLEIVK